MRNTLGLMNEFDQFFESAFAPSRAYIDRTVDRAEFIPRVDVEETDDAFLVRVDLPGVKREDVKVDVNGRTLSITGERKSERDSVEGGFRRYERVSGRFSRQFMMPESIDMAKLEANMEDGVLHVALPKAEAKKPRTIEIGSGKGGFFSRLVGPTRAEQ